MRTRAPLILAALLALAAPLHAQVTPDSVRAEMVRMRGFIRAAETQATKVLELLDSLGGAPAPVPAPEPEPEPVPPPSGAWDFESSWDSGALGETREALSDGGRWSSVLPLDGVCDVVSAGAYGRSGNVLRCRDTGTGQDGGVVKSNTYWRTRTSFVARWDFMLTRAARSMNHTPSFPQAGALVWGWQIRTNGTGIDVGSGGGPARGGYGNTEYRTTGYQLRPGTWYTYEVTVEFASDGRFRNHPRVYDARGALLFDDDDFLNEDTRESLAAVYAAGAWIPAVAAADLGFFVGAGEAVFTGGGTGTELLYDNVRLRAR